MFKILAKSFRPLLLKPFVGCSQKKQHLLALSYQLFNQYQSFKGWKTVRLLHSLTMARYDPAVAQLATGGREEEAKLEVIMGSLSGELHLLPQREVNMLLEVLKERGYSYDRTVPIFKALNKQAKLLFGRQYRAVELPKSLQLYRQLHFPKQTWVKMLSLYLQIDLGRTKNEEALRMSVSQFMRLTILALEQPFVPLSLLKGLIERLVKENASNLDTLTTLYHITRILPKSLKANTQYQLDRSNVREALFNPYTELEQEENQQKPTPEEEEAESNAEKETLRVKLNESSNQILKVFFNSVDLKKIEEAIIKSIQSDIQPLTKQNLLFACDIAQLRPTILAFLHENLQKLTPVEFMHLLRRVPAETAGDLLKNYESKLGGYMNVQERCFFLLESHRFFRTPLTPQAILAIVHSTPTLSYEEFSSIARLVGELQESDQQKIGQILAVIKSKSQA